MQISFTKMHGLGNDFMVLDLTQGPIALSCEQIQVLSHRQFGVGFDQLLQILPASTADVDFDYRIYNSDGAEVEHCGNGARCFADYVTKKGLTDKNPIRVKTVNRVLSLQLNADGQVTVNMDAPSLSPADVPFNASSQAVTYKREIEVLGESLEVEFSALSMGNPHAVINVEDIALTAVKDIGEALGKHPDFPAGVNVGFMQVMDRSTIRLRVFERGAGETLACGTGACAAVVAGCLQGHLDDTVEVHLLGGALSIQWQQADSPVLMTGPVKTVYEGTIEL